MVPRLVPVARLTDLSVQRLAAPAPGPDGEVTQVEHWDKLDGGGSLGLRITSKGIRTWVVVPRAWRNGKRVKVRVTLGRYPAMSLAEARKKAAEAFVVAARGGDPNDVVREAIAEVADRSRNTFSQVVEQFFEKYIRRQLLKPHTEAQYKIALKGPDVAAWSAKPVASITKRDVLDVLDGIVDRGAPIMANKTLAYFKTFFDWCAERELLEHSPAARISKPAKDVRRDRNLSPGEIREVWSAFGEYGGIFEPLFKLLLLTGQRKEEVGGMQWRELSALDTSSPLWTIPAERTKNGIEHLVPLAPACVQLLRTVPLVMGSPLVFPGRVPKGARGGKLGGYSKAKRGVDEKIAAARVKAGLEPIKPWVLHDLRRTMTTRMGEDLAIQPHIIEAVINHVSGFRAGVAGTYNRATYLDEKRRALTLWAEHLALLVASPVSTPARR